MEENFSINFQKLFTRHKTQQSEKYNKRIKFPSPLSLNLNRENNSE